MCSVMENSFDNPKLSIYYSFIVIAAHACLGERISRRCVVHVDSEDVSNPGSGILHTEEESHSTSVKYLFFSFLYSPGRRGDG